MKTQLRTFLQRSVATILSVIQIAVLCVSGVASAPQTASAAIPSTVGYQGRLKSASGSFLTGTYSFTFRIYDDLTAGTLLWSETQPTVTVESGVFIVRLGSVTPFPTTLDFNQPLFLATEVNSDGEMSPRVTINSVPYAYTAGGVSSNQTEQPDESSNGLDQLADPDTDASDTSAEQILSDEGLSTSTENVSTEQGAPTAVADSFDVKGAIDGILDSIKKLFERILGIEAKLEQQQQEIDELRAKIEAIQPQ